MTLLVVVLVGAVAASTLVARGHLLTAEEAASAAVAAIEGEDLATAAEELQRAERAAISARRQLGLPHVRLAARVPLAGRSLQVAEGIAAGTVEVSTAGLGLVGAIDALPEGADSLRPRDGAFPVDALAALASPLHRLGEALRNAHAEVDRRPSTLVVAPVATARDRFVELVGPATRQVRTSAGLAEHLPGFLGADAERRYLLIGTNPGELRGTGGYFGSYAIARADRGALDIGTFSPGMDLPVLGPGEVDPPAGWDRQRYEPFGGPGFFPNINMTPDFPTAASAALRLVEEAEGVALDGVIALDPFVFEALLEVSSPVELEDRRVDADEVADFVMNDAYLEFDQRRERMAVIGAVAAGALERFLSAEGVDDLPRALEPLARVADAGHLLVHAADQDTQQALVDAGVAGEFAEDAGDLLAVVVNNASATKLDQFVDREVDYAVRLLDAGVVEGRLEVGFASDAPTDGLPSHVIGPNVDDLEAGENRSLLALYCAPGCAVVEAPPGARVGADGEDEPRAIDSRFTLASGQEHRTGAAWRVDEGWAEEEGEIVYRLTYHDQPTARPTEVRVRVAVPEGAVAVDVPDGATVSGSEVVWERSDERGDARLEFRFAPR